MGFTTKRTPRTTTSSSVDYSKQGFYLDGKGPRLSLKEMEKKINDDVIACWADIGKYYYVPIDDADAVKLDGDIVKLFTYFDGSIRDDRKKFEDDVKAKYKKRYEDDIEKNQAEAKKIFDRQERIFEHILVKSGYKASLAKKIIEAAAKDEGDLDDTLNKYIEDFKSASEPKPVPIPEPKPAPEPEPKPVPEPKPAPEPTEIDGKRTMLFLSPSDMENVKKGMIIKIVLVKHGDLNIIFSTEYVDQTRICFKGFNLVDKNDYEVLRLRKDEIFGDLELIRD